MDIDGKHEMRFYDEDERGERFEISPYTLSRSQLLEYLRLAMADYYKLLDNHNDYISRAGKVASGTLKKTNDIATSNSRLEYELKQLKAKYKEAELTKNILLWIFGGEVFLFTIFLLYAFSS